MIIMNSNATDVEVENVIKEIRQLRLKPDLSRGRHRTLIGVIGDESKLDFAHLEAMPGVKEAINIETPYKIISREFGRRTGMTRHQRLVTVGDIEIGADEPIFIAGPCAVESREQVMTIAEGSKKAGAHILRGGIFKPRSSAHSFQGLGSGGEEDVRAALGWLREAGDTFGMPVISEVRGESQVDILTEYVDILQVGSRNMYNQDLLGRAGATGKPVLLKRHFGAGIEEFLSFAEYIAVEGNRNIIMCERGVIPVGKGKGFTRYLLDLQAVPVIQAEVYLPVMVDPSHAAGRRDLIHSMSCAAIAAGAAGLMIETHHNPAEAWVDGAHCITPEELGRTIESCKRIYAEVHATAATEVS